MYEVKRLACFASEYENDFIKAMIGRSAKVAENATLRKQRELDALTARDRELDMLFERLYEDNVSGQIDDPVCQNVQTLRTGAGRKCKENQGSAAGTEKRRGQAHGH